MTDENHPDFGSKKFNTQCIHAGEYPDPVTGASSPNLVMSSTFVVDEPIPFSATALDADTPYIYSRWGNPTVRQLEEKLALLEGAEDCVCLSSGMSAASAAFLSLLSSGDHIIISDTNYAGIAELSRDTLPRFGIDVSTVDTSDTAKVAEHIRDTTRLIWIETPANPILKLTDIREVSRIAHAADALLAVDSTFATPVATQPLKFGADLVLHSLTKYIGGHGDALGGAVAGSRSIIGQLRQEAVIHHGGVLSPFNAWLIMRGAATLGIRMAAHENNAMRLAQFLEAHPSVKRVIYPGLPSHPQHLLATQQMKNFSGMISFQVENGTALSRRMMSDFQVIHYAVSLGHHRSLIYWLKTDDLLRSSFRLSGEADALYREFAGDGIFRFSVGLEDPEDLEEDLDRLLV